MSSANTPRPCKWTYTHSFDQEIGIYACSSKCKLRFVYLWNAWQVDKTSSTLLIMEFVFLFLIATFAFLLCFFISFSFDIFHNGNYSITLLIYTFWFSTAASYSMLTTGEISWHWVTTIFVNRIQTIAMQYISPSFNDLDENFLLFCVLHKIVEITVRVCRFVLFFSFLFSFYFVNL